MKKVVRVAIISPADIHGKGGIESVVKYLVSEIQRSSCTIECKVIATRTTSKPWLKHISTVGALLRFIVLCASGRFDVLHINVAPRGSTWRKAMFASVGCIFRVPILLHLHGSGYDQFYSHLRTVQKVAVRRFFRCAGRVVVLGDYWRSFAINQLGVANENVRIIANGVPSATLEHVAANGQVRFLTLGILGERKGTDVLLKALSQVRGDIPWAATIAGNGEVERFKQLAFDLGIAERVAFPGWVDEQAARTLLAHSDIFILPSRAENQPIAILEAMSQGLPVISTTIGAIPDQIEDGVNGYLVSPGECAPLLRAMVALASDTDMREEMGNRSRERFYERFSIESCAAAFVTDYVALSNRRLAIHRS